MRFLPLTLALFLAVPPSFADGLPDLGDVAQSTVTPLQERRLGESIMREARADPSFYDDAELVDYLGNLGYRLVANSSDSRQEFDFFAIKDNSINAFALPGGYIGVHTGLVLAAQSESELASVLAHEIAHVTQRHLARMIEGQKTTTLASLAALAVAILAARSNGQISQAAIATAQAASIQSQLNFTRENEREADRVGLGLLEKSGFDPKAMPQFFERLQKANRLYEGNAPSYLRTHPLTYERIADVENRIRELPYKQVPDSLEFELLRAKLRADSGAPRDAINFFQANLRQQGSRLDVPYRYGLVSALMRDKNYFRAAGEMAQLRKNAPANPIIESLAGRLKRAMGDNAGALDIYRSAVRAFPRNRALAYEYADTLLQAGKYDDALRLVSDGLQFRPDDYRLYTLQARGYAGINKRLLQHKAQAEAYARLGNVPAAIEQLQIALKSGDGDFYQLSSAEARLRELRRVEADEKAQDKKQPR